MKIILSRKGFDTVNGRCASPIMPDGTLLSMPIPSDDNFTYADIAHNGLTYDRLLEQLNPKNKYQNCHLDPDIRSSAWLNLPDKWEPAFGQIDSAQGQLRNQDVGTDDLFLFFGWFREVQQTIDGSYRYIPGAPNLHVIYGYLQVERVLMQPADVKKYSWHPHADASRLENKNNAIYIARKNLSFNKTKKGSDVLNFTVNRVLTLKDSSMGTWKEVPALIPDNLASNRKNSANGNGIYYKGIWQEMVLIKNNKSTNWALSVLEM